MPAFILNLNLILHITSSFCWLKDVRGKIKSLYFLMSKYMIYVDIFRSNAETIQLHKLYGSSSFELLLQVF